MSFFKFENIRSVTGGRWLQRIEDPAMAESLVGVGIDTREDLLGRAYVAIKGDRYDGHSFLNEAVQRGARLLVVERESVEIPSEGAVLLVDDTRRALARLALAYRRTLTTTKVIAVTGSSGKTTTKRMIQEILSRWLPGSSAPKSFNNEIGVPLTILAASPRDRFIVVEIGTNAPGEIGRLAGIVEPDVAVITSIGRAHLERLGSVAGVAREKATLLSHLGADGMAIVTADSPELRPFVRLAPTAVLFGEAHDGDLRLSGRGRASEGAGWWLEINGRRRFMLGMPGRHNACNAIAAIAVGRRMGITDERISEALSEVRPEAMRLCMEQIAGAYILNDAYNSNPDSLKAALETFVEMTADAPRRVVILGDMLELGADGPRLHAETGRILLDIDRRTRIDQAILIGTLSRETARVLSGVWTEDRFMHYDDLSPGMMPAVVRAIQSGDAVLVKASRGVALERIVEALRELPEALLA